MSAWATFIGGEGAETVGAVAMDAQGTMYVAGNTLSRNLHPAIFDPRSRQLDFVLQIRATGELGWALPLGTGPFLRDIAVAPDGTVYAVSEARIIIIDRNGTRIGDTTIPKPADARVYASLQLASDPRGGVTAAAMFDSSGTVVLAHIDRDGSVRDTRVIPIGGGLGDLAVDRAGNTYLTGFASGDGVPTTAGAFQLRYTPTRCFTPPGAGYPCPDAYLVKIDPAGQVVYGTYFGGSGADTATSIAVDATGAAIIGGSTTSADLPVLRAVQTRCQPDGGASACADMFVARFDPSGRSLAFSTFLGGQGTAMLESIAVDAYGRIVVAASVTGADLPVYRAPQPSNGTGPITASFDGGRTWRRPRVPADEVRQFASTRDTGRVYAATDRGVWWSTDSGVTWLGAADAPAADVRGIAVDPSRPSTVYAATFGAGVFKSTDGGRTWSAVNSGLSGGAGNALQLRAIAVAPSAPATLYSAGTAGIFRSIDAAASWSRVSGAFSSSTRLVVHPTSPQTVWGAGPGLLKTMDGGATLALIGAVPSFRVPDPSAADASSIEFDRADPNTLYVGRTGGIARSRDGGASWQPFATGLTDRIIFSSFALTTDAGVPDRLYAHGDALYAATTTGAVWRPFTVPIPAGAIFFRRDGRHVAEISAVRDVLLVGASTTESHDAYVAAFGPTGTLLWSTFLGGSDADGAAAVGVVGTTVQLIGTTLSPDWALAAAAGRPHAGGPDIFFARISDNGPVR